MRISILGDSISTFSGWNPTGYKVFYDQRKQAINGLTSIEDTWWQKVIRFLNGELCVNNSYSGSRVSGEAFPAAHSKERIASLSKDFQPDIILVYIGMNDFGYRVPISKKFSWLQLRHNPHFFLNAYNLMLAQMKSQYPQTRIICASLMKSHVKNHPEWHFDQGFGAGEPLEKYNAAIQRACRKNHVIFLSLQSDASLTTYETLDGAHPTAKGHDMIAQCWKKALKEQLG